MTMIRNIVRFSGKQLHTIVSREIIKPSSPTPSHLKTYNLTLFDQIRPHTIMPIVTFYPNTDNYRSSHEKMLDLKKSLSQTLTKYYPFAGRYEKVAPGYVDCNDNGADFFEASINTTLSDFLQNSQYEDLDQFFPHGLDFKSNRGVQDLKSGKMIPLMVQVNHFECGGLALAVSMSHKIADGTSLAGFIDDWAKMTRLCSKEQKNKFSIDPVFIPFQHNNINFNGLLLERSNDCVTRIFTFPNSKINDLKLKVEAMTAESGQPIANPTRVEVLNWLLYKSAVSAATKNNSGSVKPTLLCLLANIRDRMMEPLPKKSIGNFFIIMEILTKNENDMKPDSFISELKKQKLQLNDIRNIETTFGFLSKIDLEEMQRKTDKGAYMFSSLCGYPTYDVDFGWGKPVKVTIPRFYSPQNCVILMDAPHRDGIEAIVNLGKQDMDIFQSDSELLAFC